jgi:hypothetical protein
MRALCSRSRAHCRSMRAPRVPIACLAALACASALTGDARESVTLSNASSVLTEPITLSMPSAFVIVEPLKDVYQCAFFDLGASTGEARYVDRIDPVFSPQSNMQFIHHMTVYDCDPTAVAPGSGSFPCVLPSGSGIWPGCERMLYTWCALTNLPRLANDYDCRLGLSAHAPSSALTPPHNYARRPSNQEPRGQLPAAGGHGAQAARARLAAGQ